MSAIFHRIYCLDIPDAIFLAALATVCFRLLGRKFASCRWWKWVLAAGLLFWLTAVLYQTLGGRQAGTERAFQLPFQSYAEVLSGGRRELLRSNFMNALLFFPAGLLGWELLPRTISPLKKVLWVTAAALLLSLSIECLQYFRMLGLAESDDVIHNTLGTALAAATCCIRHKRSDDHDAK